MARAWAYFVGPVTLLLFGCGSSFTTADETGSGGTSTGGTSSGGASTGGTSTGGAATGGASTGGASTGGASTGGASTGGVGTGGSGNAPSGGSTSVNASDFDQSCEYDSQCVPVLDGDVCGCPGCATEAINVSDVQEFDAARAAVRCPVTEIACPAVSCAEPVGTCVGGTCGVRPAVVASEGTFDTKCNSSSDCTVIPAGEVCADCQCAVIAVSTTGYQQYKDLKGSITCHPSPFVCDCAAPITTPTCVGAGTAGSTGTCKLEP